MKKASTERAVWVEGFYPATMDDWSRWQNEWSMGPHAEPDWVWVQGDYYTEAQVRALLPRLRADGVPSERE